MIKYIIATLLLLTTVFAQAAVINQQARVPGSDYSLYKINSVSFQGCTSDDASIYRIVLGVYQGSMTGDYANYTRISAPGTPYNDGYIQLADESDYNDRDPTHSWYYKNTTAVQYIKYDDNWGTVMDVQTSYYKGQADSYAPAGSWIKTKRQDLEGFSGFEHNDNCSYNPPPVPSKPTASAQVIEKCVNFAKVSFSKASGTSYTQVIDGWSTGPYTIYWSGTTTSVTKYWPEGYVRVRACNESGCSAPTSRIYVGVGMSTSCQYL